jgi:single-stranded-DNA-specific exonuclease
MPLRNENRIIVKHGIQSLLEKPRPGISDLLFKLELSGRRFGATEISWILCPAINAAGRMGNPKIALDLLTEKDALKRDKLASELIELNEKRKKIGEEIWTVVEPLAADSMSAYAGKLAIAYGPSIPRGVTGIMANRLLGRFKVPSMVASFGAAGSKGDGAVITASLRSVKGYDLRLLLEPCSDLFFDWGGHDFAAGLSMAEENWPSFLERMKSAAPGITLPDSEDEETLVVDAELPLSYLNHDILTLLDRFEPYGEGNDQLTFMAKNHSVTDINLMGKPEAKHVKLTLDTGKHKWPAVYWQAAEKVKRDFDLGDKIDLVFRINRNWFKGAETPQFVVSDLRRSK